MAIEWNKVTWYSKLLAVILFLATFVVAFRLGILYKEVKDLNTLENSEQTTVLDKISRDFSLKIGGDRVLGKVKIKLTDVSSDSRCPSDVQCIWEGTLDAKVNVSYEGESASKEVMLGKETKFFGYTLTVKNVSPVKNSKTVISKEDYVINFHIEK